MEKGVDVGFLEKKKVTKGSELFAGSNYFRKSLELISEFGLKIIQVSWRKMAAGESKIADKALTDFGFELIERGNYKLAIKVYEFYFELRSEDRGEIDRRMSVVNLSNAYKLSGDSKTSDDILNKEDWTAVSDDFKISIAAVKGDVDSVISLMKKGGKDCDIGENAYEDWPVFYHVRESAAFVSAFEDVFGRKYVPKAKERRGVFNLLRERINADPEAAGLKSGPAKPDIAAIKDHGKKARRRKLDS